MIEGSGHAGPPHKYTKSIGYKLAASVVASATIVKAEISIVVAAIRVRNNVSGCRAGLQLIDQVIVLVSLRYGKVERLHLASSCVKSLLSGFENEIRINHVPAGGIRLIYVPNAFFCWSYAVSF